MTSRAGIDDSEGGKNLPEEYLGAGFVSTAARIRAVTQPIVAGLTTAERLGSLGLGSLGLGSQGTWLVVPRRLLLAKRPVGEPLAVVRPVESNDGLTSLGREISYDLNDYRNAVD